MRRIAEQGTQPVPPAQGTRSVPGGGPAAQVGEGQGLGVFSNTPSANSGYGPGGEDTIHLACGVEWRDPDALWAMLEELKQEAKRTGRPARKEFLGFALYVLPHGRSGQKGGPNITYMADTGCVKLEFLKMGKPKETTPNLYVKVGSQACLVMGGAAGLRSHLRCMVEELGGELVADKVSRVDLCVDLVGDLVTPIADAIEANRQITRAVDRAKYWHGQICTGVTVGSGSSVMLRVYRKDMKCDPELWDLLQEHRFGREQPESFHEIVTRVEFQIRREQLRDFSVVVLDDYIRERAAIWKYLTDHWFRLADDEVDRTNTTRERVSAVWEEVREAGRKAFGGAVRAATRVARHAYDAVANGAQAAGNGIAKLVAANAHVADADDLIEKVQWAVADTMERDKAKWYEKWRRKDQFANDRVPRIRGNPHDYGKANWGIPLSFAN